MNEKCVYCRYFESTHEGIRGAIGEDICSCRICNESEVDCPDFGEAPPAAYKHDAGKPRLSLVPPSLIEAVGIVRTYGTDKYNNDPDGWRNVAAERYDDAMMRHLVAYLRDHSSVDEESGLPHLWHLACNVSFLIELRGGGRKN